jgi:hypothetical protein
MLGATSSAYGATVSEPSGFPSRRNVTATTRPDPARAVALRAVGFVKRSGPSNCKLGGLVAEGAAGESSDGEPVQPATATVSAANVNRVRFARLNVSTS